MNTTNLKDSIIGKQFGAIVPIRLVESSTLQFPFYECKCLKCGRIIPEVDERDILGFSVLCCGKCNRKDYIGMKFGKLTIEYVYTKRISEEQKTRSYCHCKCDCGKELDTRLDSIITGKVRSCGCIKHPDLIGKTFGSLVVEREIGVSPDHTKRYYVCKCKCGVKIIAEKGNLCSGHTTSCGSCSRTVDIRGMKFGRLTPMHILEHKRAGTSRIWHCKCDCGNECDISTNALRSGHTRSCGCLSETHVRFHTLEEKRLNHIHYLMLRRCYNESSRAYKWYGKRGISVCNAWREDVWNFINWALKNGYMNDLTLDRIDVNGDYCPENCRWVSMKEQANNKTSNHFIKVGNETLTITQWSRLTGIPLWKMCGLSSSKGDDYTAMVIGNKLNLMKKDLTNKDSIL